jgi:hypothetical protein
MITLVGNCQLHRMQYIMELNGIVDFRFFPNSDKLGEEFNEEAVKEVVSKSSFIVAQPIHNSENPLYFRELLSLNKNILFVPYIFIDGFFSLSASGTHAEYFYGEERVIPIIKERGLDIAVNAMREGNIDFDNEARFQSSIDELKARELECCGVFISDAIISKYKDDNILTMHNHPSPELFDIFCHRIFEVLGIPYRELCSLTHGDKVAYVFDRPLRVFSPYDVERLGLNHAYDEQWFLNGRQVLAKLAQRIQGDD